MRPTIPTAATKIICRRQSDRSPGHPSTKNRRGDTSAAAALEEGGLATTGATAAHAVSESGIPRKVAPVAAVRSIIRPSNSPWAAQCLCVKEKDGDLRLCIDWEALNEQLVVNSGGLGGIQTIFDGLKRYFTEKRLGVGVPPSRNRGKRQTQNGLSRCRRKAVQIK